MYTLKSGSLASPTIVRIAALAVGVRRGASGWRCEAKMYVGMNRTKSRSWCSVNAGMVKNGRAPSASSPRRS